MGEWSEDEPLVQMGAKAEWKSMPRITVKLVGEDGNAFNLLGIVSRAMRRAGATNQMVDAFHEEATAGDYDKLLQVCMDWVDVT